MRKGGSREDWRQAGELFRLGRKCPAVLIHSGRIKLFPSTIVVWLTCRGVFRKLRKPDDLTIVLAHNRPFKTVMERSLRFTGGLPCEIARLPAEVLWRNTHKITEILRLLKSIEQKTRYVMYCDADDCVPRNDPQMALDLLEEYDCKLLFSGTPFAVHDQLMPGIDRWVELHTPEDAGPRRYLNAGVWVGEWDFVVRFLEAAAEYVSEEVLSPQEFIDLLKNGTPREVPSNFPAGVSSDQTIFRYIQPRFHPELRVDHSARLALRYPFLESESRRLEI